MLNELIHIVLHAYAIVCIWCGTIPEIKLYPMMNNTWFVSILLGSNMFVTLILIRIQEPKRTSRQVLPVTNEDNTCLVYCVPSKPGSKVAITRQTCLLFIQSVLMSIWAHYLFLKEDYTVAHALAIALVVTMSFSWLHIYKCYSSIIVFWCFLLNMSITMKIACYTLWIK